MKSICTYCNYDCEVIFDTLIEESEFWGSYQYRTVEVEVSDCCLNNVKYIGVEDNVKCC